MPPSPGLNSNTLRQVFKVSVGGEEVRMAFSNQYGRSPLTLNAVRLAESAGAGAIDSSTEVALTFNGATSVTLAPGQSLYSDAAAFPLEALTTLAVTIHFGSTPPDLTGHPGSRTTSYLQTGSAMSQADLTSATKTDHWYVISGLEVKAPLGYGAVAIIGDSITDGRGSGVNRQNRWPDELAKRLQANSNYQDVAVLNQGIGGGCLTRACLGPAGVDRFQRDVLDQQGVRWLIVLIGINDIGTQGSSATAKAITDAYSKLINQAHAAGIKVYGATLTPSAGSQYGTPASESARSQVNNWIRTSGRFDAVIDMEAAIGDQNNPPKILPSAHDGDWLHPNEQGYRMMAEAVDLTLFNE